MPPGLRLYATGVHRNVLIRPLIFNNLWSGVFYFHTPRPNQFTRHFEVAKLVPEGGGNRIGRANDRVFELKGVLI